MLTDSFGPMDGTYFVSRGELIQWLNSTFSVNVSKIEELATGAVYCKIFDECMPGKLQMSKVNWNAKQEYEYIANFKILQQGFTKCNIKKNIDVEKLVKGKCQDNLEMLQWMKKFSITNCPNIKEKRGLTPTPKPKILTERNSIEKLKPKERGSFDKCKFTDRNITETTKLREVSPIRPIRLHSETVEQKRAPECNIIVIDSLQKERDFYFEKLREIEMVVNEFCDKEHPLAKKILSILYSDEI